MPLATTPELLRELATLYQRIADLERAAGMRPGEGAPDDSPRPVEALADGLHAVVAGLSDDAVGVLSPAGDVLHVNDAIERLIGWRPDELIGKNAWALVHPEDLASLASARSTPLDDGVPIEIRVRCADGSEKWLEFTALGWPAGAPRYVVGRWRDADARRVEGGALPDQARLADELRRAAALARLSQLALGLPQIQDVVDAAAALAPAALGLHAGAYLEPIETGLRVRAESGLPAAARNTAVPRVMTLAALAHASGAPARAADVERDGRLADPLLAAAGARCAVAVPVRGKERAHGVLLVAGREPRQFEAADIHFLETVANVVATSVDARAAQEALRGRERLARAVFDGARDGLAIVDDEGRFVDANPGAERILGASFEALRGRRPAELGIDLDLSARAGARQQSQVTIQTPRGTRLVEWDVQPDILPGLGLAAMRDVTERRDLQTRLAVADRLISVGTIAAGVAHELDTPLAYVTTNLEHLAAALPPLLPEAAVPGVRDALGEALEGVERLRVIIEDLRPFLRVPGCEPAWADLEAVLRSCVGMTWNQLRQRARVERDVAPLPPVAGSPARLAQVFVNLLLNAAEAIPPGAPHANVIRVVARVLEDGRVAVEVIDSGAGIPPSVLAHVFEPFFTTKPPGVGTGLGLPICRSILEAMGGSIEVKSPLAGGTSFRVVLPAADPAQAAARSAPPPEPPARIQRSRVLVVDDEARVGSALARALAGEHDVTALASPQEALRRVERGERFDVLLTDLVMPGMGGASLARALVALDPRLAGRVIFMTAGALPADGPRDPDGAAIPCLAKPLKLEALRRALAEACSPGRAG